jgi:hypothetical protein
MFELNLTGSGKSPFPGLFGDRNECSLFVTVCNFLNSFVTYRLLRILEG